MEPKDEYPQVPEQQSQEQLQGAVQSFIGLMVAALTEADPLGKNTQSL